VEEVEKRSETIPCFSDHGKLLAEVEIELSGRQGNERKSTSPLVRVSKETANEFGESEVQLREHGRYRYRVRSKLEGTKLGLRESHEVIPDIDARHGAIEPSDHCGSLRLEVVDLTNPENPIANCSVEVRSLKIGYREDYRGMLNEIAKKSSALLIDSRISSRINFEGSSSDHSFMEQQFEFLRNLLTSRRFKGAVEYVLRNPQSKLREVEVRQSIRKPVRTGREFSRQMNRGTNRIQLPSGHPISNRLTSVPETIVKVERIDDFDTPENRFIKLVLEDFRSTLLTITNLLSSEKEAKGNERILKDSFSLGKSLDDLLKRGFLSEVSRPSFIPHGSTTLQGKEGYRQIYLDWLQFHSAGVLKWDGGEHVYGAGARNVSTLYEYWLFFALENLFRKKFSHVRPLHEMLVTKNPGMPRLTLNNRYTLETPIEGVFTTSSQRKLRAEFHFNKQFSRTPKNQFEKEGTWTRAARPDYTFTIWPAGFSKPEAEANELLVHIHFDAKYRVDNLNDIIGSDDDGNLSEKTPEGTKRTQAKYDDLLKMHAYRDAIRRTAGAYVIYPGNPNKPDKNFEKFHELIPGLGAFPVRPSIDGEALGIQNVSKFIDKVLEHLSNRTTARERLSYHQKIAYESRETITPLRDTPIEELDLYQPKHRAVPPAEHIVLVAWFQTKAQLEWSNQKGLIVVRLGKDRPGSLHVVPEISSTRHIMLRTHNSTTHDGLWKLTKPGFNVYTAEDLQNLRYPEPTRSEIYAVFQASVDDAWKSQKWDGKRVIQQIEKFEADRNQKEDYTLGRTSPKPRFISLQRLLENPANQDHDEKISEI
jgi:predicted component of viral defense system (DUF524 family)